MRRRKQSDADLTIDNSSSDDESESEAEKSQEKAVPGAQKDQASHYAAFSSVKSSAETNNDNANTYDSLAMAKKAPTFHYAKIPVLPEEPKTVSASNYF
jgi:hypothetical protein